MRGANLLRASVVESGLELALAGRYRVYPGPSFDFLQGGERLAILLPALDPRHQHQVEAVMRAVGGPQGPVRLGFAPASRFVAVVEEIDVHSPGTTRRRCTSRVSNPDPRLTNPIL